MKKNYNNNRIRLWYPNLSHIMVLKTIFRLAIYYFIPMLIGILSKPNWYLMFGILIPYMAIVIYIDYKN